jgi:hypothetical protein
MLHIDIVVVGFFVCLYSHGGYICVRHMQPKRLYVVCAGINGPEAHLFLAAEK